MPVTCVEVWLGRIRWQHLPGNACRNPASRDRLPGCAPVRGTPAITRPADAEKMHVRASVRALEWPDRVRKARGAGWVVDPA